MLLKLELSRAKLHVFVKVSEFTNSFSIITAKKLPKSDNASAGPAVGRQPRGVDLRETNEPHQGGCCK